MEQIGNTLLLQDSIGGPPIRGTWELVKPEQARKWVEEMPRNRRGRVAHRKSLERKMDAGRYMERIADPIRFDWDGYLSDGENRLTAVVESGEVLYFLILDKHFILHLILIVSIIKIAGQFILLNL